MRSSRYWGNRLICNISEFKSARELQEMLNSAGIAKSFAESGVILSENAYIQATPVVTTGSIRVMRTDADFVKPGRNKISLVLQMLQ